MERAHATLQAEAAKNNWPMADYTLQAEVAENNWPMADYTLQAEVAENNWPRADYTLQAEAAENNWPRTASNDCSSALDTQHDICRISMQVRTRSPILVGPKRSTRSSKVWSCQNWC